MFEESIFATVERVISPVEAWSVRFHHRKPFRKFVDVQRFRFDHRKACIGGL